MCFFDNTFKKVGKADVDLKNGVGHVTALHAAAYNGSEEVVSYLVGEAGAEVDVRDLNKESPFYLAARRGHLVRILKKHCHSFILRANG